MNRFLYQFNKKHLDERFRYKFRSIGPITMSDMNFWINNYPNCTWFGKIKLDE